VERGSFVRAAAHLGITPSALSQTIRGLEEELGVRLLHRTTRSLAPTAPGEKLLARLAPTLRDLDAAVAETTANRADGKPAGRVRISTSKVASEIVIAPRLGRFLSTYPDVVLELVSDERLVDIVAERFDAGLRLGEQVVRDMVAVQVGGRQRLVVVGTPKYFARHGRPRQPKDLLAHRCVVHFRSGGEAYRWELEKGGRERQVAVTGALFENDPRVAELAVLTGEVIGFAFEAQMAPHLANGRLETVLDDWCPSFPGFHLYYPSRREVTPALRAFIETMKSGA
jgi:DNA-binding transcriptional LysR family regulator